MPATIFLEILPRSFFDLLAHQSLLEGRGWFGFEGKEEAHVGVVAKMPIERERRKIRREAMISYRHRSISAAICFVALWPVDRPPISRSGPSDRMSRTEWDVDGNHGKRTSKIERWTAREV